MFSHPTIMWHSRPFTEPLFYGLMSIVLKFLQVYCKVEFDHFHKAFLGKRLYFENRFQKDKELKTNLKLKQYLSFHHQNNLMSPIF